MEGRVVCVTKRSETKRNVKGRKKYAAVAVDPVVVTERAGRVTGVRTPSLRPRLRVLPCWVVRPGGKGGFGGERWRWMTRGVVFG